MDNNSLQKLQKLSKGLSVLFLEKDNLVQRQIENILDKTFSSVYQFSDESIALQRYSTINADIVLLGLPLVNKNGIDFIADIKQINPNVNIIVVSDNNDDFELLHTIDFGIKKLILKPITLDQIIISLIDLLENLELPRKYHDGFEFLENIFKKNKEVKLVNSYKGIPISSSGVIESIDEDCFIIKVQPVQQAAVKYESHTILTVEGSEKFIHAHFLSFEPKQNLLKFVKPKFINFVQRELGNKRLKVDDSFKLGVYFKNKNIEASVKDISLDTISILIEDMSFSFETADMIDLTLGFDIDTAVVSNRDKVFVKVFAKGKVSRVQPYKNGFLVTSSLSIQKSDQSNFKKYIKSLEMEIIKEFKYLVRR